MSETENKNSTGSATTSPPPPSSSDLIYEAIQTLRTSLLSSTPVDASVITQNLLVLKKQSRNLHEDAFLSKEKVKRLKKETDAANLSLQSANYEKKHLERELPNCLATKIFDTVDFADKSNLSTPLAGRKALMDKKLFMVKEELKLRQGSN